MKPQKIANLQTRMVWYQKERKSWFKQSALFFLIVTLVTYGFYYLAMNIVPTIGLYPDEEAKYIIPILGLAIFLFGNGTANPFPKKPAQKDIEEDQALRRAHGMSDEVEEV
jgi:hypothetical protein